MNTLFQRNILFSLLAVANQPRTIGAESSHIFRFCVSFRYGPKSAMDADLQEAIDFHRTTVDPEDGSDCCDVGGASGGSHSTPSWNRILGWLQDMDSLRKMAINAA